MAEARPLLLGTAMDAIDMLRKDHDTVRDLFRRYHGGGGITGLIKRTAGLVEARTQRDVLRLICRELAMHTRIEEEVFYPAVRELGARRLAKLVDEAVSEHAAVKAQVADLEGRTGEAESLSSEVSQLEKNVEHHAREEEREMFPRLTELMSPSLHASLAKRMQSIKRLRTTAKAARNGRKTNVKRTTVRGRSGASAPRSRNKRNVSRKTR